MTPLERIDKEITTFISCLPFSWLMKNLWEFFAVSVVFTIKLSEQLFFFKFILALAGVGQLVGASSHKPKGHSFNSGSGHMLRLRVQSSVWAHVRGIWLMFLSHINVSLLSLSLSSPRSKKLISMSSGEDKKKFLLKSTCLQSLYVIFTSSLYL